MHCVFRPQLSSSISIVGILVGYINAMHLLYLHHCFLYLHRVQQELDNAEITIFILDQRVPLHIWQVIIYCAQIIINIYLAQLIDIILNIDIYLSSPLSFEMPRSAVSISTDAWTATLTSSLSSSYLSLFTLSLPLFSSTSSSSS